MSTLDRRDWLKRLALVVGGSAAAGADVLAQNKTSGGQTTAVPPAAGHAVSGTPSPGVRVTTGVNDIVETTAGKVRGFTRNGVHIFRGIPYGDTTAGGNRFVPAKKPKPWTGVRSSTSWGPVSPHPDRAGWRNDEEQFLYQWDDGFAGEDMLRVNVWTPAVNDGRKRAVLVWIHGGGFVSGSSQELRPYDGSNLASRHDVVLVSMNHRLNVFGFLDLSQFGPQYASSANVGMLDLVLALEWVRDNIANFGGDPASVTIFGQSGGARKVSTLLAMPAAR
jgi:para-nitrobenzyl esterase